jgi:dienelactone hydrolase
MPKDMKFLPLYEESLKDNKAVKNAVIKVENIKGPILLVSSDEDKVWPSKKMCDNIKERLNQNNFSFKIEHVNYSQVGHMAGRPGYRPWTQPFYVKGGEPSFNGRAQADLWKRILKFLKENLY